MKVKTTCGAVALLAVVTGAAFAQDSPVEHASQLRPEVTPSNHAVGWGPLAVATSQERVAATSGPSPLGYLAVGSGAALLGCVWLSRRYRIDG